MKTDDRIPEEGIMICLDLSGSMGQFAGFTEDLPAFRAENEEKKRRK
jgi:hypothetical protein